jgi:hypothetical protein
MILSYRDILGDDKRHRIRAIITTDHAASSYGQPVIVLPDGQALDWVSMILMDYRVEKASKKESILLERLLRDIAALTGGKIEDESKNGGEG